MQRHNAMFDRDAFRLSLQPIPVSHNNITLYVTRQQWHVSNRVKKTIRYAHRMLTRKRSCNREDPLRWPCLESLYMLEYFLCVVGDQLQHTKIPHHPRSWGAPEEERKRAHSASRGRKPRLPHVKPSRLDGARSPHTALNGKLSL
jgi:hypothetical protein